MLSKSRIATFTAEFLGTTTLVMVAIILAQTTAVSYFIATSLALTLAMLVVVFGVISGAHVNPAITLGMWAARRIGTLRAVGYIAAQLLGGLAAWQLYQYFADRSIATKTSTFDTRIWLAEVVGTFILGLGVAAALSRGLDAMQSALASGAAIFTGIMVAATASAAYINPAIALGQRAWSAAYILGPLVGGIIGVNLYYMLFAPTASTSRASAVTKTVRKS